MNVSTMKALKYADVSVGDELPNLDVPLTRTRIVSTAIASRDYQDVHHDPDLARERGSPDIFMNILTSNGFVGRFITDWAGPNAVLKSVRIRLGAPNYPGDTMVMSGQVTKKEGGVIEVAVRGSNSLGDHVTGTVALELPDAPIAWGEPRRASGTTKTSAQKPKKGAKSDKAKKPKKGKGKP